MLGSGFGSTFQLIENEQYLDLFVVFKISFNGGFMATASEISEQNVHCLMKSKTGKSV